jgi:hypothetical protein
MSTYQCQHTSEKPQHCPYSPNPIKYGKDNQDTIPSNTSPKLNEAGKKRIQQIVGSFLYYTCAVDPTIHMALLAIAAQQSAPTEQTHISMPAYVAKQLLRYKHPHPEKPQHCPYSPNPIKYGKYNQDTIPSDTSPKLNEAGKKRIQQIVGSFLYYARAVDPTIHMALLAIAA